jgi:uncharacterized protein (TIGR02145 family)
MKKLYFIFLLLPLWGLGGLSSAWAQSIKMIGADFTHSEVTFSVDLSPATSTWVFVEHTTPPHSPANMSRATFTSVTFNPPEAGTLTAEKRGFWLTGSATVTAKLKDVSGVFSWSAYAIGVPPNARVKPEGGYELRGTPPFTINNNITVNSHDFDAGTCITSITDFTYNPAGFFPDPPKVTVGASETEVCLGAEVTFTALATGSVTDAMSYTWNIAGTKTTTTTNPYITTLANVGEATYTVFVTNANNCTSMVSAVGMVAVIAVPVVKTVSSETICSGTSAVLSATASDVTTPATYTWNIEGYPATWTTTNTYTTPALTATANYTVQITNDTGCTSAVSPAGMITVNPLPVITIEDVLITQRSGAKVTLTASGAEPGGYYCFTYECIDCVHNPFLTGENMSAAVNSNWNSECTYTSDNTYPIVMPDEGEVLVWVRAKSAEGCVDSVRVTFTVMPLGTNQEQGSCTFTQPELVSTFATFPANYSAATFVTLQDDRDKKNYTAVRMPDNKWWMAQNLNYQLGLMWQPNSTQPSVTIGQNTALIGHFWCPGEDGTTTSSRASCDVWGALYSFETAMMADGKWSDDSRTSTAWTDVLTRSNPEAGNANNGGKGAGRHGICPANWHVPTDEEWGELLNAMEPTTKNHNSATGLRGADAAAHGRSSCACDGADQESSCANDTDNKWVFDPSAVYEDPYGFRALPSGYRYYDGSHYQYRGTNTLWWTSSAASSQEAWLRGVQIWRTGTWRGTNTRSGGLSVRCVRN